MKIKKKKWAFIISSTIMVSLFWPLITGQNASAVSYNYLGVLENIYINEEPIENSAVIGRMEISETIWRTPNGINDVWIPVELPPGEKIAPGAYRFEVEDWSLTFVGKAANLGTISGNWGYFRWGILDYGSDNLDWLDLWAGLGTRNDSTEDPYKIIVDMPSFGFWGNWNWTDASAEDCLKLPDLIGLAGHVVEGPPVTVGGEIWKVPHSVPEPNTTILLGAVLVGLIGLKKKFEKI